MSAQPRPNGCPFDPWCERCPCAVEDDACFPGEALRAERDHYHAALQQIIDDWLCNPQSVRIAEAALRREGV